MADVQPVSAEQPVPAQPRPLSPSRKAFTERIAALPEQLGAAAVPVLRAALNHLDPSVRLAAVGALGRLDHADARAALATALHDDSFGVDWAAARALAAAGRPGVVAVLEALVRDTPSAVFLHGVEYVLRHAVLADEDRATIAPVLDALRRPAADLEAPIRAEAALPRLAPTRGPSGLDRAQPAWYDRPRRRPPVRGFRTPVESAP